MRRLLVPAAGILLLAGCGTADVATAPDVATGDPSVVLLDVSGSGGMCAGACHHPHLVVRGDGSWTVDGGPRAQHGTLTDEQRKDLDEALSITGLSDHRKHERFCDSWVDGTDLEVRWRTAGEQHRATSCDFAFAADDPLLGFASSFTSA